MVKNELDFNELKNLLLAIDHPLAKTFNPEIYAKLLTKYGAEKA